MNEIALRDQCLFWQLLFQSLAVFYTSKIKVDLQRTLGGILTALDIDIVDIFLLFAPPCLIFAGHFQCFILAYFHFCLWHGEKGFKRIPEVVVTVCPEFKPAAFSQYTHRLRKKTFRDHPSMRFFIPGDRKVHEDLFTAVGRKHFKKKPRIIVDHPDILKPLKFYLAQNLLGRGSMDLQSDEKGVGVLLSLPEQVSSRTESYFNGDLLFGVLDRFKIFYFLEIL